jgi:hypothetical protein
VSWNTFTVGDITAALMQHFGRPGARQGAQDKVATNGCLMAVMLLVCCYLPCCLFVCFVICLCAVICNVVAAVVCDVICNVICNLVCLFVVRRGGRGLLGLRSLAQELLGFV